MNGKQLSTGERQGVVGGLCLQLWHNRYLHNARWHPNISLLTFWPPWSRRSACCTNTVLRFDCDEYAFWELLECRPCAAGLAWVWLWPEWIHWGQWAEGKRKCFIICNWELGNCSYRLTTLKEMIFWSLKYYFYYMTTVIALQKSTFYSVCYIVCISELFIHFDM